MNKNELYEKLNQLESAKDVITSEFGNVQKLIDELIEENIILKAQVKHYEELLSQNDDSITEPKESGQTSVELLQSLYEQGFHICNVSFGEHRRGGDCLFCEKFFEQLSGDGLNG